MKKEENGMYAWQDLTSTSMAVPAERTAMSLMKQSKFDSNLMRAHLPLALHIKGRQNQPLEHFEVTLGETMLRGEQL